MPSKSHNFNETEDFPTPVGPPMKIIKGLFPLGFIRK
jgi:hypothetical protein